MGPVRRPNPDADSKENQDDQESNPTNQPATLASRPRLLKSTCVSSASVPWGRDSVMVIEGLAIRESQIYYY